MSMTSKVVLWFVCGLVSAFGITAYENRHYFSKSNPLMLSSKYDEGDKIRLLGIIVAGPIAPILLLGMHIMSKALDAFMNVAAWVGFKINVWWINRNG